jgi:enoyl-CoA hydratase
MPHILLDYHSQHQIAVITLNRPGAHHAINEEMMTRLEEMLDEIESSSEVRVVILTASGLTSFCAGGDLKYFVHLKTSQQARNMSLRMQSILKRFWSGKRVVIAAINGQAFGGGCEILTACHFRIASNNAQFSFRQAANGVITGWGGGLRLFKILGHKALHLLLTADKVDARVALQYGFVDTVVEAVALLPAAMALASKIIQNSDAAVKAFLDLYRRSQIDAEESVIEFETEAFADLWVREDFQGWLKEYFKKAKG